MFWVISVYFNIRNTLPKSGTFLLGHLYKREVLSHGNHVAWIIEAVSTNDVQEKLWFMSQPNRIFFLAKCRVLEINPGDSYMGYYTSM